MDREDLKEYKDFDDLSRDMNSLFDRRSSLPFGVRGAFLTPRELRKDENKQTG